MKTEGKCFCVKCIGIYLFSLGYDEALLAQ